ncbi:hypothetical protein, partial [Prevotella disiens]|uniref:hypothetical protein n=1 Tax=Prevotella disiens TaxID=28130 RepID=UPI00288BA006
IIKLNLHLKLQFYVELAELQLTINSVLAVDGTKVMLSSANLSDEGNNNLILSLFLCFLIKGGSAEIPAGMECTPIVAGATTITL